MEYRQYNSYEEKIAELEKIFGQWPPPFDPVWAVQVSQGRCGSNGLWSIVNSFFEGAIGEPVYEALGRPVEIERHNPENNWIPKEGKNYLYYNVHAHDPYRLHFPFLFWLLQNSPKVVHLIREDHLTRAISDYFDKSVMDKIDSTPVDFPCLERYIWSSIFQIELVKRFVSEFVTDDRLLRVSHYDLYYADTLNTIRKCARFLECDPQKESVKIGLHKRMNSDRIPNKQEVMDRYERDFTEQRDWIPEDIDARAIEDRISETVTEFIRLNVS